MTRPPAPRAAIVYDSRREDKPKSTLQHIGEALARHSGIEVIVTRHRQDIMASNGVMGTFILKTRYRYDLNMGIPSPGEYRYSTSLVGLSHSQIVKHMAFMCDIQPLINQQRRKTEQAALPVT